MTALYRGDVVALPDGYRRPKDSRCRWYAFIGAAGCDSCEAPAYAHDGDLRPPEGAGPFTSQMEGRVWSDEIRVEWRLSGRILPPRVPDGNADQAEWVEWLTHPALDAEVAS